MELRRVPLDRVREARDASQVPSAVLRVDGPVTPVELEELRARFVAARGGPVRVVELPGVAETRSRFTVDLPGMTPAPVSARRRAWRDAAGRMVR